MLRVMLVDDEAKAIVAIEKIVNWEELGLSLPIVCTNALDALEELKNNIVDILITDVKMPIMNGIELINHAKKIHPFLQCIILSGYDEFPMAQAAMIYGVKYYLLKPCIKKEVEQAIIACIAQLEKDKREAFNSNEGRKLAINEIVTRFLNLATNENGKVDGEQVREIMMPYQEHEILNEVIFLLAKKGSSAEQTAKIIKILSSLVFIEDEGEIYKVVADFLNNLYKDTYDEISFVEKMKQYVNEKYYIPELSLRYIADNVLYMNVQYIGKQFYKSTGMKFSEYLMQVRMKKAQELLKNYKNLKMYEIAEKVGLEDNIQYFYYLFKKYTGVTPKQYQDT